MHHLLGSWYFYSSCALLQQVMGLGADNHPCQASLFLPPLILPLYLYSSSTMMVAIDQIMSLESKGLWVWRVCRCWIYINSSTTFMLSDGKTKAKEEQVEAREIHIINYEKCKCVVWQLVACIPSHFVGQSTSKSFWSHCGSSSL